MTHPLTGYAARWSAKAGASIGFSVASAQDRPFTLRFVRHVCADPNPQGPGYNEIPMPTALDGEHPGQARGAYLGSFGKVASLPAILPETLTLSAAIWPTTPEKGRQGIVSLIVGDWHLSLGVGSNGGAMIEALGPDGTICRAEVGKRMLARRWYDLRATLAADGTLHVLQTPHAPLGDSGEAFASGAAAAPSSYPAVFLAALPPVGGAPACGYFNGKIERPAITGPDNGAIAAWDFAQGIPTQTATDTGPHGAHAELVNLPTRAMTGSNWSGIVHDWKSDPAQYGAIHFHDDDQGALGWPESFSLDIPADWPSGFYAAHISNDAGQDYIPFFVRPAKPRADIAVLVPTFTYQVYGCFVRLGRGAEIAARAAAWNALPETPDMNPQFGLSAYNYHSDGSGVCITSQHRPMLDTRPRQFSLMDPVPTGSGTGRIAADSYFVQFLTSLGLDHDIVTDHDLHEEGVAALSPYRLVIAAQHPEYHSDRMMQGLEDFLTGGGRLMYLGGNGFYWRAEPVPDTPHALEIRRAEGGIRVWATEPGENYHSCGAYGGLWRRIGRASHKLVGSGFSSQGRHLGFPFRFIDGIDDPRVAFMTDGLAVTPGEVFGDAGYMGGGAAGFELDSVNAKYGTPPNTLVVAKGIVVHPDYGWVNEDMLVHRHPLPVEDWSCADMLFFETPAGGAVFSAGSMTYAGSLPVDGGNTVLGRLTANVVRRFADPAPFSLPAI